MASDSPESSAGNGNRGVLFDLKWIMLRARIESPMGINMTGGWEGVL